MAASDDATGGVPGPSGTEWRDNYSYSLNAVWNIMDWTTLTFIPSIMTNETHTETTELLPGQGPIQFPKNTQYSYEARFSNPEDSKLIYTLGYYMLDSAVDNSEQPIWDMPGEYQIVQLDRPTDSWAVFGQATYPVTEKLRLVAGGRYTYDKRIQQFRVIHQDENSIIDIDSGLQTLGETNNKPTYKVGAEYDLTEDSMTYLMASTGYKSGGVTFGRQLDQETGELLNYDAMKYRPEKSVAYELGSKNRFLKNRLQVNGSLYATVYEGAQVQMWEVLNAGTDDEAMYLLVRNAGRSYMYGAEVETTWLITSADRLSVNVSSMKGTFNDLVIHEDMIPFSAPGQPPAPATIKVNDMQDVDMPNMPRFNLHLGYQHAFNLATYGVLSPSFDVNYKTKYYNNVTNWVDGSLVPAHYIADCYLNWVSPKGMFSANAFVKNIFNEAYAVNTTSGFGGSGSRIMLNNPRTFNVSLAVKF